MAAVNKVILVGNLGDKPELRYTQGGTPVANASLATNEKKKDREGNWIDHTEWHRLIFWNKLAEVVDRYAGKGKQLYVEGKLRTRKWKTKEGDDRYTTEIVVDNLVLLGAKGDAGDRRREREDTEGADYGSGEKVSTTSAKAEIKTEDPADWRDDEDDLPF